MQHIDDITGRRFGSRVVIERTASKHGKTYWICRCDCGTVDVVSTARLLEGLGGRCLRCFRASVQLPQSYVKPSVTGAELRAEGLVEVGTVLGTNVIFAKTERRLCLFFADQVAEVMKRRQIPAALIASQA